jgi:hypothetical protein
MDRCETESATRQKRELIGMIKSKMIAAFAMTLLVGTAFAGPGDGDLLSLLKRSDSRGALNLSGDVLGKIDQLFGTLDKQITDLLSKASPQIKVGGFSLGKAPSPDGLVEKLQNEFRGQMVKLLDPAQLKQAFQMGLKAEGNFAFLMPEVAKEIKLDKDSKKAVEGFRREYMDLAKSLTEQVKKGTLTDELRLKQLAEKDSSLQDAIAKAVKPEFLEQLRKLADKS